MSLKSVSQIFKILFQTGDINTIVLRGVFFSRYVQLICSIIGRSWSSAKLFIMQNYTDNANGGCAFNGRKCMIFLGHVHMRPGVKSNQFEILLRGKISLRC